MVPEILNALLLLLINRFSHVCLCATPPIDVVPRVRALRLLGAGWAAGTRGGGVVP